MSDTSLRVVETSISDGQHPEPPRPDTKNLERRGRDAEPINALESARKHPEATNVGRQERFMSLISGAALIAYGLNRRGWLGLSLAITGGGLAARGITGHCTVYGALNVNTAEGEGAEARGVHVEQAITIDASPERLYTFWRDFENQPLVSNYLNIVTVTGETTSHWEARGPGDKPIQWDAAIIHDIPNELISWKTLEGADIEHAGTVRFRPAPGDRGTEVHVTMQYYPPAGALGAGIAKLMHREPSIEVADTLKRLKRLIETGEIVTVQGQSHGQNMQRSVFRPNA